MDTDIKNIKNKTFEADRTGKRFTSSQKELIAFLEKYKAEHGKMPTLREAAALLGCSFQNLSIRFIRLYWKGYGGLTFKDTGRSKIKLLLESDPARNYKAEEIVRITGLNLKYVKLWFSQNRHHYNRLILTKAFNPEAKRAEYIASYGALAAKLKEQKGMPPTLAELADAAGLSRSTMDGRLRYYGIKLDLRKGYH